MKNLGVVLAVGITAVIVITIGFLNFFPVSEPQLTDGGGILAPVAETIVVPDMAAVAAAFDARQTLLEAQIAELDAEYANRLAAYDLRVEELSTLIVAGEGQLPQLQDQETVLQEQIDQLHTAQSERITAYESQRQQAYYQYQVNIQQLQAQLDEANAKLYDSLGQLGQ